MRADLLDAMAAVNWAEAQLPVLHKAIESFQTGNPYRIVKQDDPEGEGALFVLKNVKTLPPTINAEVGAILNSTRSSLDLLSAALARRNGKKPTRHMHFPIWDNPNDIADPIRGIDGRECKKWLSDGERRIIKSLKPYPGGNNELVALHELDIVRKHERLVDVNILPGRIRIDGDAAAVGLAPPPKWPRFQNDAVIALGPLSTSERNIHMSLDVTLDEPFHLIGLSLINGRPLVVPTLFNFARLAAGIIQRFDYP
jgi:hypothetical protein